MADDDAGSSSGFGFVFGRRTITKIVTSRFRIANRYPAEVNLSTGKEPI